LIPGSTWYAKSAPVRIVSAAAIPPITHTTAQMSIASEKPGPSGCSGPARMPAATGSTATASSPATREMALLTPERHGDRQTDAEHDHGGQDRVQIGRARHYARHQRQARRGDQRADRHRHSRPVPLTERTGPRGADQHDDRHGQHRQPGRECGVVQALLQLQGQ
jgi:hypothetical protein